LAFGEKYWDVMYCICNIYIISQYLTPAIIYRDIIYALYPSSTPSPPKTTAIFRDFKKSTAMCKVHNVGLRYIKVKGDAIAGREVPVQRV
jgi:hypothetical protein